MTSKNSSYSYNVGLWGVSIGGAETHSSTGLIPETAWYSHPKDSASNETITLHFEKGIPTAAAVGSKKASGAVEVIKLLTAVGNDYSVGRHYHVGTSIPGKKGRLAYESPAADIVYEAHRTLEKLVLSQSQITYKKILSEEYGRLIHEAKFFDPLRTDIEKFLSSSQERATGICTVTLGKGFIQSTVADSPYNLLALKGATYGETSEYYNGRDAQGATKLHGFEQLLYRSKE